MCLPTKPYAILREWDHAGLKCAVSQGRRHGHLCGYVRVPPGHPFYGKNYDDVPVSVHGGLTLGALEPCNHEDGQGWWFGFDCGHMGTDLLYDPTAEIPWLKDVPESTRKLFADPLGFAPWESRPRQYWRQPEVEAETVRLAEQLAKETV